MMQQVNLFQPIFRKERKLLSFEALLQISGIMLLALLLLQGIGQWQTTDLQSTLTTLEQQKDARLLQLEELTLNESQSNKSSPKDELARLNMELVAQRTLAGQLSQAHTASATGFSQYLEGLAHQMLEGMWLTSFRIAAGGNQLILKGNSLNADLIPRFIEQLSREPAIAGTQFNLLQLSREETTDNSISFILYTDTDLQATMSTGQQR